MIEKRIDPEHAYRTGYIETTIGRVLRKFRGPRLVDMTVDTVTEIGIRIGIERARVDVTGRISVGDRGVRTSYLIPDNKTADPRVLDREVSVLTAEG